jgi:nicotinamidase-related amidase
MSRHPQLALDRANAALLVIDVQERLGAAMDPARFERLLKNNEILVETARTLGLPILVTEQYPKGLGPTVPAVRKALPPEVEPISKVAFSAHAVGLVADRLKQLGRSQIIVTGMETHVCVFQSVRDLIGTGYVPFVPRDAVLSRTPDNHETGLALMRDAGATLTSTETVVFDLLGEAGTPEFKKLSALVK